LSNRLHVAALPISFLCAAAYGLTEKRYSLFSAIMIENRRRAVMGVLTRLSGSSLPPVPTTPYPPLGNFAKP